MKRRKTTMTGIVAGIYFCQCQMSSFGYLPMVRVFYSGRVDGDLSTEGYSLVDLRQT